MTVYNTFPEDNSAWQDLTKEQVKERKEEWKHVQVSLKKIGRSFFKGSYLKAHRHLFFNGRADPSVYDEQYGFSDKYHCEALFYLWYYPYLTNESCRSIMEYYQADKNHAGRPVRLDRLRLIMLADLTIPNTPFGGEYGFMGERETMIVKMLLGEPEKGAFFDQGDLSELKNILTLQSVGRYLSQSSGVLKGAISAKNRFFHRIWPQLTSSLEKLHENQQLDDLRETKVKSTISQVVYFEEHPDTAKDCVFAREARDLIYNQYKNGQLYSYINDWFDEAESNGLDYYLSSD